MPKRRWIGLFFFFCLGQVLTLVRGEETPAPAEELARLELACLGREQAGSLIERLGSLEDLVLGRRQEGTIPARLAELYAVFALNTPHRPSLAFQLNAVEWALYHRVFPGPFLTRLAAVEKELFGRVAEGPWTSRLAALRPLFWREDSWPAVPVDLAAGTPVKVELLADISSQTAKPGDTFPFAVAETVFQDGLVILPRGSTGEGRVVKIVPPGRMGRDAEMTVAFGPLTAIDGTPVPVSAGDGAITADISQGFVLKVTTAGMLVLGPAGILSGLFVRGKELFLAKGTNLWLQTKGVTACWALAGGER